MPEARIASVTVPAKRPFNITEPGVNESEPFKAKTQKKNGRDSSSFSQSRAENGSVVTKKKGTIRHFLNILVLSYIYQAQMGNLLCHRISFMLCRLLTSSSRAP